MSMNEIESRAASLIEGIIMTPVDSETLLIDSGLVD